MKPSIEQIHYGDDRNNHLKDICNASEVNDNKSNQNNDNNVMLDEFGRIKSDIPKKTRWPPCFDTNGSAFILDTRSGMFYESVSDFFYDPKSKLYYGNKQGTYFQYDPVKRSFHEITSNSNTETIDTINTNVTTTATGHVSESSNTLSATQPMELKKPSIKINLKIQTLPTPGALNEARVEKKSDGRVKDKSKVTVPDVVPVVSKKYAANIEKWSERQNEIRQDEKGTSSKVTSSIDDTSKIATTNKGEPICLLCRRRFPNLDKLRHHEEVSNLHKDNLAKQQAILKTAPIKDAPDDDTDAPDDDTKDPFSSAVTKTTGNTYIDRAEQRRRLHKSDSASGALRIMNSDVHSVVSLDTIRTTTIDDNVVVPDTKSNLDETNIGHKMLQKLGWKAGNILGRDQVLDNNSSKNDTDAATPISSTTTTGTLTTNTTTTTTTSLLKQDWDRIESISKSLGKQGGMVAQFHKKGIGH
jgi:RNA-binding protein 5/10